MVIMINVGVRGTPWRLTVMVLLTLPASVRPADWSVVPVLRVRESYSDNMNLAPPESARGQFTTEVAPGVTVSTDQPRLKLAMSYSVAKVLYSEQPDRTTQHLDAAGHSVLLQDWLYLDGHAAISQQNVSAFGPQLTDPVQQTGNAETVRSRSFSPYLQHRFSGLATAVLRYSYQHVSSGGLIDVQSDDTNLRLTGDNGGQGWNWDFNADRRNINDAATTPVTMSDASLTLSYPLNNRLSMFTTGGYEENDYHSIAAQPHGRYWSVGATWTPSLRTRIAASVGRRFFGQTYSLDAQYSMRNMFWTANYNENITTTHGQFLSIPPTGLSDFLFDLWATRIPDPVTRRQTIKVFLLISQMLGTDGNVNFFSHRYYLQKELMLGTVYSGRRSALMLNLSNTRRTAQTSAAIDSILLGPDELALEDRTRQTAIQAGWNWRTSPRSSVSVGAAHNRVQSLSTGRQDRNSTLNLSMTHQLSPKVSATFDARHTRHTSNAGGNYRENSVSAAVMMAF
jgi:uncharacterized protein (PEP-CTERM system associated)